MVIDGVFRPDLRDEELRKAKKLERNRKWAAANRHKAKQYFATWINKHPNGVREQTLKKYNITSAEWTHLFDSQGNRCAICRRDSPVGRGHWYTDHCHTTGRVRGILCARCNLSLGHMGDDPAIIRAAADYLERFTSEGN